MLHTLLRVLLPCRCALCGRLLPDNDTVFCGTCTMGFPLYSCDNYHDNEIVRIFWKRLPVVRATAWLNYNPHTLYAKLITGPKYSSRDDIAHSVGYLLADHLAEKGFFDNIDVIVPMPTTTPRFEKRGMNQVVEVARSMVKRLHQKKEHRNIKLAKKAVQRIRFTLSQTTRQQHDRVEAISSDDFRIKRPDELNGRHILLLDDVVTTGTTLTALGQAIMKSTTDVHISILAIGHTEPSI